MVQAADGHISLLSQAELLADLLHRPDTPVGLKQALDEIEPIKIFAREHGLTATRSYNSFAAVEQEAVVWVITACPAFNLEPKTWNFPIVGSFPYIGFFSRHEAEAFAKPWEQQGLDVFVRGAGAYSTLGWFSDPVLSTMLTQGNSVLGDLVNTVLHESMHATFWLKDQGYLNESVAEFTAQHLTPEYLAKRFGPASTALRAYEKEEQQREFKAKKILAALAELQKLYQSPIKDAEKLIQKITIFRTLEQAIPAKRSLNNAAIEDFRFYHTGYQSLTNLLKSCDQNWHRFFTVLRTLDSANFSKEQQAELDEVLNPLSCAHSASD